MPITLLIVIGPFGGFGSIIVTPVGFQKVSGASETDGGVARIALSSKPPFTIAPSRDSEAAMNMPESMTIVASEKCGALLFKFVTFSLSMVAVK